MTGSPFNIVIAGVGGQGTVLASRILGQAAIAAGLEVRTAENIGMAQREGAVVSFVRLGRGLAGPLVPSGQADILLGFELAEAARALSYLRPGGRALINVATIIPPTVSLGISTYDATAIRAYLEERIAAPVFLPATDLARQAGNYRATNVVMLGALSGLAGFPLSAATLEEAVLAAVPARLREVNARAFALGRDFQG